MGLRGTRHWTSAVRNGQTEQRCSFAVRCTVVNRDIVTMIDRQLTQAKLVSYIYNSVFSLFYIAFK